MTLDHSAEVSVLDEYQRVWNSAGTRWDCEGLASCFTEDALFFGGRPEHSIGRSAIKDYFLSYVGVIASCSMRLRDQQVVDLIPGCLLVQGYCDFSFVLCDGQRPRSVVRTKLLLVQQAHGWNARLQHFGPPPAEPPLGRNR